MINVYTFLDHGAFAREVRLKAIETWKKNIPNANIVVLDFDVADPPEKYKTAHWKLVKGLIDKHGEFIERSRRFLTDSLRISIPIVDEIDNYLYMDSDIWLTDPFPEEFFEKDCYKKPTAGLVIFWSKNHRNDFLQFLYKKYNSVQLQDILLEYWNDGSKADLSIKNDIDQLMYFGVSRTFQGDFQLKNLTKNTFHFPFSVKKEDGKAYIDLPSGKWNIGFSEKKIGHSKKEGVLYYPLECKDLLLKVLPVELTDADYIIN